MKRNWTTDELIDHWTLLPDERTFVEGVYTAPNQLGVAVLLKSFQYLGRFPQYQVDIPASVIDFVARQLNIQVTAFAAYGWTSRTVDRHRRLIRQRLGFRAASTRETNEVAAWVQQQIMPHQRNLDALKTAFYTRCRAVQIEPPTPGRVERLLRSALRTYELAFCQTINDRLTPAMRNHLDALLIVPPDSDSDTTPMGAGRVSPLQQLKQDAGALSVESVITEGEKLGRIRALTLPATLFAGMSFKILDGYRQRVGAEDLTELRRHPPAVRYTLLAAFCWVRGQEITDALVELLINLIHRIGARAEKQVDTKLLKDLKRVRGKTRLLYEVARASLTHPVGIVQEVVYPAAGGEKTLQTIVEEWQAHGSYDQQVHTTMHGSYRHHYRRIIPIILRLLTFQSNNAQYQPIMTALNLLRRYAEVSPKRAYYASDDDVPLDGVIPKAWRPFVVHTERGGKTHIKRAAYELGVLQTMREKLRCKELWVEGANKYRNPDDDLPADFHIARDTYYADLQLPLDVEDFIVREQAAMQAALEQFNRTIVTNHNVKLITRQNTSWITLSPLEPQPEARYLQRLKAEVGRRWRWTNLLDMVKETDLRTHFTDCFQSVTDHENLDRTVIQKRLLLCLYGLGTNMGLKRVSAGDHGESYRELLYTMRRYLTKDQLRAAIAHIANATLQVRNPAIWGEGTTACASDSKKMGAWDQNLLTEWHIRYRGPGIMVYWHVEKKSLCIYSQVKRCSSSEVAAMIEGVLRHCTDMTVEKNYVDSHGQSEIGFAFCSLLGFQLLPRLKAIGTQKLYRPETGAPDAYANLQPILTRPINWGLIRQQYDEMIKYTTALRLGTAESEAILRRFTRNGPQHPTYQALAEYGKVRKTIFLCEYLGSEALRQEIHDGLNTVENWNSAITFIFYGKGGEIATNQRDDQERAVLAMHLLQICLVYINTLMVQQVFHDPTWLMQFQPRDFQALHPLFYNHVNPYGEVRLNMQERIALDVVA